MTRFIVRRLLLSIPVLFGVVVLVFILARIIPGDPCVATYGEKATEEVCDAFNAPIRASTSPSPSSSSSTSAGC